MTILSALAQYSLIQSRIDALLQESAEAGASISLLLNQSDAVRDKILNATPRDEQEAVQKLACLVNLIQRDARLQGFESEIAGILDAAQSACAAVLHHSPCEQMPNRPPARPAQVFGGSIADYVTYAQERVTFVDTSFTIVALSAEAARAYGCTQIEMMGAPLADLIGESRFRAKAEPRLKACFQGGQQSYHVAQSVDQEAVIMRCDMKPVHSGEDGLLGALVYMTDVTEQAMRLRSEQRRYGVQRPARSVANTARMS